QTLGFAVAVDAAGYTAVAGTSASTTFPTSSGVFQTTSKGGPDAFVTLWDPYGAPVFSTLFGGRGIDEATGVGFDPSGNVVLTGLTSSQDLPTKNAAQPQIGGSFDAFVAKLNRAGSQLVRSTYLGGSGLDGATGLEVDLQGGVY